MIVNLTHFAATADQAAAGVIDLDGFERESLLECLTFDRVPDSADLQRRAQWLVELACHAGIDEHGEYVIPKAALIDPAPILLEPLVAALKAKGIRPVFTSKDTDILRVALGEAERLLDELDRQYAETCGWEATFALDARDALLEHLQRGIDAARNARQGKHLEWQDPSLG